MITAIIIVFLHTCSSYVDIINLSLLRSIFDNLKETLKCFVSLQSPPIPWSKILTSLPFWAIMLAHMGQNYGYETLMTELPTFMRQVLHFSIKDVSFSIFYSISKVLQA